MDWDEIKTSDVFHVIDHVKKETAFEEHAILEVCNTFACIYTVLNIFQNNQNIHGTGLVLKMYLLRIYNNDMLIYMSGCR